LLESVDDVFVAAIDHVSRQAVHCHRVLRAVQMVAEKSTVINSKTWDALLRFLLAVNDVLLAPPTEKGLYCLHTCRILYDAAVYFICGSECYLLFVKL